MLHQNIFESPNIALSMMCAVGLRRSWSWMFVDKNAPFMLIWEKR